MAQVGLKPWQFSSQESTLTAEPAGHWMNKLQSPLINHIRLCLDYVCIYDARLGR